MPVKVWLTKQSVEKGLNEGNFPLESRKVQEFQQIEYF